MSNGGIEIHGRTGYFNLWRGALYSVLLGAIYKSLFDENLALSVYSWVFCLGITVFLLIDGVTRFNSREMIRRKQLITMPYEFIWIILEMAGLFFFVCWAYHSLSLSSTVMLEFGFFIGLFSMCVAIHNALLINADEGVSFVSFVKTAILGDASEIISGQVSERWQAYLTNLKSKYIKILKSKKRKTYQQISNEEEQKQKPQTSLKTLFQIFVHFILGLKEATILGLIHLIIQFTALHLFVFNLTAAIIIFGCPDTGLIQLAPIPIGIILFVSVMAYSVTSYKEMERHDDKHDNSQDITKTEKVSQTIGNLLLVTCIVVLYLSLPKSWLIIAILLQQMVIGSSLLLQANPDDVKSPCEELAK